MSEDNIQLVPYSEQSYCNQCGVRKKPYVYRKNISYSGFILHFIFLLINVACSTILILFNNRVDYVLIPEICIVTTSFTLFIFYCFQGTPPINVYIV